MEFFIKGNTFAAPFVSDPVSTYIEADSPIEALQKLHKQMETGIGLYAANAYGSADDYHKSRKPLASFRCNEAIAVSEGTSIHKHDGVVEVDGKVVTIDDPKGGVFDSVL